MSADLESLRREADRLLRDGPNDRAIEAHRKLLALDPEDADTAYNLGWLLSEAGRREEALEAYREVIAMGGNAALDARLSSASLLMHLRREDEAERALEELLALVPDHGGALLNLGRIHEDRGERDKAVSAYRKASEAAPDQALPLARLLGAMTPGDEKDTAIARGHQLWSRAHLTPIDRADLGFAMTAALDQRKAFADAWKYAVEANEAARAIERAHGRGFSAAEHEAFVDRCEAAAGAMPRDRAEDGQDLMPLFVCGLYRSGSTLLEQMLTRHSQIESGGEFDIVAGLEAGIAGYPDTVATLSEREIADLRSAYLDKVRALGATGPFVVDKSPENFLHLGLIRRMFPDAPVIETRRDRLDNLLSIYFHHLAWRDYANAPESLAFWHGKYVRLMEIWRALPGKAFEQCRYSDLVGDTEATMRRLLEYVGLEFEEACLQPEQSDTLVRTASVWQVREKIHGRAIGRAANYPEFVARIEQADR